jgi:hypothetical protein
VRLFTTLPVAAIKGGKFAPNESEIIEVSFPPGDSRRWIRSALEIEVKTEGQKKQPQMNADKH